jgi:hypothetical protein
MHETVLLAGEKAGITRGIENLPGRKGKRVETEGHDASGQQGLLPAGKGAPEQAYKGLGLAAEGRRVLDPVGKIRNQQMGRVMTAEGERVRRIAGGKTQEAGILLLKMLL